MLSYASFLVLSILVETNVFFPVNLPTCVVHWPTDLFYFLERRVPTKFNKKVALWLRVFHLCPGTIILLQLYLLYLLMRNLWSTQFFNLFNHYKQVFLLELYHRVKGFKCPLTNHWTKNVPIYYFGWTWNCTYKYYSILDYIYPVCLFLIGFLAD